MSLGAGLNLGGKRRHRLGTQEIGQLHQFVGLAPGEGWQAAHAFARRRRFVHVGHRPAGGAHQLRRQPPVRRHAVEQVALPEAPHHHRRLGVLDRVAGLNQLPTVPLA